MADGKTRTDAEKERAKDRRYQLKYGITSADKEQRIRDQNRLCKICNSPLDYAYPCVDHFHFRIRVIRWLDPQTMELNGWEAQGLDERGQVRCLRRARTQVAARKAAKLAMLAWSVRGILCYKCNYSLGVIEKFLDAARNPAILDSVKEYLLARHKLPLTPL